MAKRVKLSSSFKSDGKHGGKGYMTGDYATFDDAYAHELVNVKKCASFVNVKGELITAKGSNAPPKNENEYVLSSLTVEQTKEFLEEVSDLDILKQYLEDEAKDLDRKGVKVAVQARIAVLEDTLDFEKAVAQLTTLEDANAYLKLVEEAESVPEHIDIVKARIAELEK